MELSERSKQVRREAIKLSVANGGYHYGGTFSCVEILIALYDNILTDKDRFILSKGHSCWAYYYLLQERGYMPKLEGHPCRDPYNGVTWSTGSMGHGFPAAVGIALAKKIKHEEGVVFVLMGDGECQEGTTWESLLLAKKFNLDNLVCIIDNNIIQGSGYVNDILPNMFLRCLRTNKIPEINTVVVNGHSIDDLYKALKDCSGFKVVIANTVKGKGIKHMENNPEYHAKWIGGEELNKVYEELKK